MRVSDSLPGFGSPVYPRGDPRARALLNYCRELFPKDKALVRSSQAVQTAKDINGAEPGLALASIVIGIKLGFGLLSFEPTRTFLAYLSATKGFESGGYDTNGTTKAALASAYNPENVWSYEGGFKSEMFERHLRLNMSVYDADYKDLQTRNFDPVSGTIVAGNAAKARVRGVELESQWVPTDFLTLGVTYDYADAKYLSYLTPNASGPPTDYSGHTIPNTPRNAVNVNGDLHFRNPFGPGRLSVGGDVTYRTQIQFDDANDTAQFVLDKSKYRGLANLHATWRRDDDKLDFTVWAKNLTNTQSVINSSDLSNFYDTPGEIGAGKQVYITTWTAARTAGVSVTARF